MSVSLSLRADRQVVSKDTIARTPSIVSSTPGASLDSQFIDSQLPPLDSSACPNHPPSTIRVINSDSFTAARAILREHPEAKGKVAVLNLASDEERGGGWAYTLCKTQEEALCYSSTLYATLKEEYYPWPNLGPGSVAGVYSPAIVVFKDDLDHGCVDLPENERAIVSVITVAAPCLPKTKITSSGERRFAKEQDLEDMRGKIRLVYRMAGWNGQAYLVLAAMGCGVYACPPKQVAEEMKAILLEPEFKGWFKEIVFAIYSNKNNGPGNFDIFNELLDGTEV
ncbi:hypothetical protein JAAARDRAFT_185601 [Jaapia argillacea MUCL 33604]|uniref:Microbial-type PARG catalytic domain-containing protein n=1 Tax=Jaapia argillacea MUCL 33604 TaxID=933084 RepID=A0A067PKU9_9AGAM|nr:hypothetical protein JAAARDRAFT_185601 [Jaapia argillacea MUCL 33604]